MRKVKQLVKHYHFVLRLLIFSLYHEIVPKLDHVLQCTLYNVGRYMKPDVFIYNVTFSLEAMLFLETYVM